MPRPLTRVSITRPPCAAFASTSPVTPTNWPTSTFRASRSVFPKPAGASRTACTPRSPRCDLREASDLPSVTGGVGPVSGCSIPPENTSISTFSASTCPAFRTRRYEKNCSPPFTNFGTSARGSTAICAATRDAATPTVARRPNSTPTAASWSTVGWRVIRPSSSTISCDTAFRSCKQFTAASMA